MKSLLRLVENASLTEPYRLLLFFFTRTLSIEVMVFELMRLDEALMSKLSLMHILAVGAHSTHDVHLLVLRTCRLKNSSRTN